MARREASVKLAIVACCSESEHTQEPTVRREYLAYIASSQDNVFPRLKYTMSSKNDVLNRQDEFHKFLLVS